MINEIEIILKKIKKVYFIFIDNKMFDLSYAARLIVLIWRYKGKKSIKNIFSDIVVDGSCWTNDLDFNFHMNNSQGGKSKTSGVPTSIVLH